MNKYKLNPPLKKVIYNITDVIDYCELSIWNFPFDTKRCRNCVYDADSNCFDRVDLMERLQ